MPYRSRRNIDECLKSLVGQESVIAYMDFPIKQILLKCGPCFLPPALIRSLHLEASSNYSLAHIYMNGQIEKER